RLEGPDLQPLPVKSARQSSDDQRLADIGAGSLKHDGGRAVHGGRLAQNSIPCCAFTPSRKGCLIMVISVTRSAAAINSSFAFRPVTTRCSPGRRAVSFATPSSIGR